MSMRKEWFEEVDGKSSRFERLYYGGLDGIGKSIANAFRTLLTEDAAAGVKNAAELFEMSKDCILEIYERMDESGNRIATLDRKVKRLRKRGKEHAEWLDNIEQLDWETTRRLDKLESFIDGAESIITKDDGIKHVTPTPAPTPRPFREGDVVRLLEFSDHDGVVMSVSRERYAGQEAVIWAKYRHKIESYAVATMDDKDLWWPASALELVTAVDAPEALTSADILAGEVVQLEKTLFASQAEVRRLEDELTISRDACIGAQCGKEEYRGLYLDAANQRDSLQAQLLQVESFVREHDAQPARISKLINQRKELSALNKAYGCIRSERDTLQAKLDEMQADMKRDRVYKTPNHTYHIPLDCMEREVGELLEQRYQNHVTICEQRDKLDAANAAYRARVEAGKVVYGHDLGNGEWTWSYHEYHGIDKRTALLIDEADIAPAVEQKPKKEYFRRKELDVPFVSENTRKGERRQALTTRYPIQLCRRRAADRRQA